MFRLTLRPGRDRSVRKHHPWIFSGAFADAPVPQIAAGETVEIVSAEGECLGYGSYSPSSQIRVRMLSFDASKVPDEDFIAGLVAASLDRRDEFFCLDLEPHACRLINAESDGLPGVVVDAYSRWAVCQFTSAGAERWKNVIVAALNKSGFSNVSERADVDARLKEGLPTTEGLSILAGSEPPELIEISEGKIRYFVDVCKGHKTGFYLDQRDARAAVTPLAAGRSVLNCFSYTGGFGLAAAIGEATRVTQVDVSADALELARKNAELTLGAPMAELKFEYEQEDVFRYLRKCRDARKTFDLIVLDPPKFAESKSQVMKAARGYKDINLLAMKLLNPGGILATFSCSGAMDAALFDKILGEAAQDAHRDFQMIGRTRQGADHPVALNFPEGLYLKGVILRSLT